MRHTYAASPRCSERIVIVTTTEQPQDNHFDCKELTALTRFVMLINDEGVFAKMCVGCSKALGVDASDMVRTAVNDINDTCEVDTDTDNIETQNAYQAVHALELLYSLNKDLLPLPVGLLTKCHELYTSELDELVAANVDRLLGDQS